MRLHLFLLSFLCLAHLPCCFSVTNPLVRVQCNASLQTIALQSIWFETRRKGRGGERAREGVIRHTLMYAHRHTHRHRHTDTHTQTQTHRHRHTHRHTQTHTHAHTHSLKPPLPVLVPSVTSERDRRRNRGLVAPHLKHPPVVHSPAATYDVARLFYSRLLRMRVDLCLCVCVFRAWTEKTVLQTQTCAASFATDSCPLLSALLLVESWMQCTQVCADPQFSAHAVDHHRHPIHTSRPHASFSGAVLLLCLF